ncbi:potassium-transporting ATPase subunit KdpC [Asticcacaulis sp. EMRT-3]|uniref:potassium-transporting ATPase subunit KdpC n=1 Tax=Asticcacaulis sp. EMRT-3 TaxID=3040349 RepID=UPI0024AF1218|nr:potassium-transporting ATPase subunit KdpC [Asticcacaulis sp. EMRT-3]MDI7776012.1 potassium-transporting ATPase subunit KdpC [Asticcacaulis sp. EMRT-3]
MNAYLSALRPAIVSTALLTVLLGGVYPAVTTAVLHLSFHKQAEGSLIRSPAGRIVGSERIGQNFDQPRYLWGRLSATGPTPYNAGASSGSNFGVNNPALLAAAEARIKALKAGDPGNKALIPVDLVTASGSGLDPEISPAAAQYQVGRIAKARAISPDVVRAAIAKSTKGRTFGILGEPRVNVLEVNLRLDGLLT